MDNDPIPLLTGRGNQLLNVSVSANVPMLVNSSTINGPSAFFFSTEQDLNKLVITPQNEWLMFTLPRVPGWTVAVTLCFDSMISINAKIVASSDSRTVEPSLTAWDASSQRFNTEPIRRQLGAVSSTNLSDTDHGIMTLETTPAELQAQVSQWIDKSVSLGRTNTSFPGQNFLKLSLDPQYSSGTLMCTECELEFIDNHFDDFITYSYIGMQQKNLFQDVLESTADTALAWQALYTLIGRSAYNDLLSYFDIPDSLVVSWFREAQFPRRARGLIAVITVLGAHLMLYSSPEPSSLVSGTMHGRCWHKQRPPFPRRSSRI